MNISLKPTSGAVATANVLPGDAELVTAKRLLYTLRVFG